MFHGGGLAFGFDACLDEVDGEILEDAADSDIGIAADDADLEAHRFEACEGFGGVRAEGIAEDEFTDDGFGLLVADFGEEYA